MHRTSLRRLLWASALLVAAPACTGTMEDAEPDTETMDAGAVTMADGGEGTEPPTRDAGGTEADGGLAEPPMHADGGPPPMGFDPPGDRVVNLADEGLSEGDLIDPYLEEHFVDGNEVHIPEGTYRWDGTSHTLGDASLIGDGEGVVFDMGDGFTAAPDFVATHGTVLMKNITQRGAVVADSRHRNFGVRAEEGATLILENFNRPDGQVGDGNSTGWYVHGQHAGEVIFRNCTVIGFGNNGIYGSSPGGSGDDKGGGRVVVEGGLFKNNNVASVRVGSDDSVVRNVTVVHDGRIPRTSRGTANGRGIWVREDGDDITIENCDVTFTDDSDGATTPLYVQPRYEGGSGTVRDVRISYGLSGNPLNHNGGTWTGSGVHITGTGDLEPGGGTDDWVACTGSGCDAPTTEKQWVSP